MASTVADLVVRIKSDTTNAVKGMGEVEGKASKMKAGIRSAALPAAAALAAVGAAAVAAGNAAAEDAQGQAILANTMKKTTGANKDAVASMEDYIAKVSEATGVTDDELRPAMGNLLRATGDATKSQEAMQTALDVSAATGKDLGSVTEAMAKAYGGNAGALKRLVPTLSDAAIKSGDMSRIMKEMADQTGGAMAASADTAAGKMKKMQTSMGEAQEEIGTALLPAMAKFADILAVVATFIGENTTLFYIIVGVIAGLAAAILVANAAISVYTIVTTIAGSATAMAWLAALGPILLVIAAIALVVGAVVLLWKKSETFRTIVLAVWGAIKTAVMTTGSAIKTAFLATLNAIEGAAKAFGNAVSAVWNAIRTSAQNVIDAVKRIWSSAWDAIAGFVTAFLTTVKNTFTSVKEFIAERVGNIKTNFENVWNSLVEIVTSVWGKIKDGVSNGISGVVNLVGGLPGKIKGALSGAATMLKDIGYSIITGLGAGIDAAKDWLMGKINAIADSIPGWLKKRLGIASPSKVTELIGKDVMRGLAKGMDDGKAGIKALVEDIAGSIADIMAKRFKDDANARKATRLAIADMESHTKALKINAGKRQAIYDELATQQASLEKQITDRASLAASTSEAILAFGSITNLADKEATTAEAILADMGKRLAEAQAFAANIAALRAAGLSESAIQDLVGAGVEAGGAVAAGLLAGGPEAIAAATAMQTQLDATALALGEQTAAGMYDAGILATQGLIDGLLADQTRLEKVAETLAENFANAVAKAIRKAIKKIKSGGGSGGGGDGGGGARVAVPTSAGYSTPSVATYASTRAPAPSTTVINVTGAIDPEATARQIRRILAGHDRRVGLGSS